MSFLHGEASKAVVEYLFCRLDRPYGWDYESDVFMVEKIGFEEDQCKLRVSNLSKAQATEFTVSRREYGELMQGRNPIERIRGFEDRFLVIKHEHIFSALNQEEVEQFAALVRKIVECTRVNGKNHTYLVINTDEPYADEVAAIMKKHGHGGSTDAENRPQEQ